MIFMYMYTIIISHYIPGSARPPGIFHIGLLSDVRYFSCISRSSFLSFNTKPPTPVTRQKIIYYYNCYKRIRLANRAKVEHNDITKTWDIKKKGTLRKRAQKEKGKLHGENTKER